MMLINIVIFESPLIGIHSTVSSKLFVYIFISRMCYSPGSTNAIGQGCWASPFSALFTLIQLTGMQLSSLTQITRDSRFEPGMRSAQSLGLAVSIIDYSHVPIFLILLITHVKSQKKKYNLFYRGKEQITK